MKKVNVPVDRLPNYAGKWVAIKGEVIIAVGSSLEDIRSLVVGTKKYPPEAGAFRVPDKGKGPFVYSFPR
jgi:hypothetical protein